MMGGWPMGVRFTEHTTCMQRHAHTHTHRERERDRERERARERKNKERFGQHDAAVNCVYVRLQPHDGIT